MKILIGLGNVGAKYLKTRHNAGFLVLDQLAQDLDLEWKEESKFKAVIAKSSDLLLVKPTTMMNLSGQAASKVLNFFKVTPEDLVVVYDDIDLPLGTLRFRETGSAGTHNGMKSIIEQLGTKDFKRLRVGVETRGEIMPEQMDTTDFVLGEFTEKEFPGIKNSIKEAVTELKTLISA